MPPPVRSRSATLASTPENAAPLAMNRAALLFDRLSMFEVPPTIVPALNWIEAPGAEIGLMALLPALPKRSLIATETFAMCPCPKDRPEAD